MGKLDGRVVLISGVARGQGRSHAVRFAEEGASVVGFDLCRQVDTVTYPMPGRDELEKTVKLVEGAGGRIVAREADVRDAAAVQAVVDAGVEEFGRVDFVLANAGIMPILGEAGKRRQAWYDAIDVMLSGVLITIEAALPQLLKQDQGGAVVITSSSGGLTIGGATLSIKSDGLLGYVAAKHGVVGLVHAYANMLGASNIRVNSVHPCGVNSPMIVNEPVGEFTAAHPEFSTAMETLLPTELVEPSDVSDAMVYLCSDSGRYITGITLSVDAGLAVG